jgi:Cys-rich four helix bundle protein (predicted Tat secretion target)
MNSEKGSKDKIPAPSATAGSEIPAISRRTLLSSAGAIGAALAGGLAYAADGPGHEHANHAPRHADALDAANQCSKMARLCLAHCLVSFQEGDTTLAVCARSVHNMISLCDAFSEQVISNSKYIQGIAQVCRTACVDCEKECRKHENDHVECRQCADACVALISAIDEIMT